MNDKQREKILLFCGFKPLTHQEVYPALSTNRPDIVVKWRYPDGDESFNPPDIDLNFFDKWVFSKLNNWTIQKRATITVWLCDGLYEAESEDDNLLDALTSALEKLIDKEVN